VVTDHPGTADRLGLVGAGGKQPMPGRGTPERRKSGRRDIARGVRQAALLFVVAGWVGLLNDAIPGGVGYGHPLSLALDAVNVLIGVWAWLGSRTFTEPGSLALPLLALANVGLNNAEGFLPAPTYGVWFVLIFIWVGLWHRPRVSLALAPFATAAYLCPFLAGAPTTGGAVPSVLLVVPMAVAAGELLARSSATARRAKAAQAEVLGKLLRENVTDPLTGVGNRRFADMLVRSLAEGDALAVLDLDHFKDVNDRFGHLEGDEVLRQLGSYLQRALRENDAVARIGGEEFIVVLRRAGQSPHESVQRLLDGWRQLAPRTTFSAGLAVLGRHSAPEASFSAADQALYAAKEQGRDRLVVTHAA
jgi:diguanylate cyclase (GGDEF)-like protein